MKSKIITGIVILLTGGLLSGCLPTLFNSTTSFSSNATVPTISISSPSSSDIIGTGSVSYTLTYSQATAVSLSASDVTVNATAGVSCSVAVSGSGLSTRTVTLSSCSGDGEVGIVVSAGSAINSYGSALEASSDVSVLVETLLPTVTVGDATSSVITDVQSVSFTLTFNDAVTVNLTDADVLVSGDGTAASCSATVTNGTTQTPTVTLSSCTGNGLVGISIAGGAASNAVGGSAQTWTIAVFTVVNPTPDVTIGAPSVSEITGTGSASFIVTFTDSEAMNLTSSLISLNTTGGASCSSVVVTNGTTATPTVTLSSCTGNGTVGITVLAGAADNSVESQPSATFQVETSAPTLSIAAPSPSIINFATSASFVITYSNADSVSLSSSQITLNTTGGVSCTVAVSGTGSVTRTVTVSGCSDTTGTVGISVAASSASNLVGAAPAAGPSATAAVVTVPALTIGAPSSSTITSGGSVTYPVTYGGATAVTLAVGNVSLNTTGSASCTPAVSGSGLTSYTVTLSSCTGSGTVGISIAANTASNGAGQAMGAGPSAVFWISTIDWNYRGQPNFSSGIVGDIAMALDSSGYPYVAFEDGTYNDRITVMHWSGTAWNIVGTAGFSAGQATLPSMALDSSGNPYVGFVDGANNGMATVMHWNGSTWATVGTAGFSPGAINLPVLGLDLNNNPYLAFLDTSNNASFLTVMHYSGSAWSQVGASGSFSTNEATSFAMVIDSSGNPYVAYFDFNASPGVRHWNGTTWVDVGSSSFAPSAKSSVSLALDSSGNPYAAYMAVSSSINSVGQVVVQHWNGSIWTTLGSSGVSGNGAAYPSIVVDTSNTPYVAYADASNGYKATVMSWNGSAWNPLGSAGFSEAPVSTSNSLTPSYSHYPLAFAINAAGVPQVAINGSTGKIAVFAYRLDGSSTSLAWTQSSPQSSTSVTSQWVQSYNPLLTDQQVQYYADEFCQTPSGSLIDLGSSTQTTHAATGVTGGFLSYRTVSLSSTQEPAWSICSAEMGISSVWNYVGGIWEGPYDPVTGYGLSNRNLALDSSGYPYVAYADPTQYGQASVAHWNGSSWSVVGTPGFSIDQAFSIELAVDSSNTPYVAFAGADAHMTVMDWNGTDWVYVGGQQFIMSDNIAGPSIAISSSGTPWVTYIDETIGNYPAGSYWNGTEWVQVFPTGEAARSSNGASVALDTSGNPYVAYADSAAGGQKLTVMHLVSGSWSLVGSPGISASQISSVPSIATDSSGNPYVVYADFSQSNKATVQYWNGTAWSYVGTEGFTPGAVGGPAIAVNSSNEPCVVYLDGANDNKISTMCYNGTAWSNMGDAGFSLGVPGYPAIATGASGEIAVFYTDSLLDNLGVVREFFNAP